MDYCQLTSNDDLTQLAKLKGIRIWKELLDYVRDLPYDRITDRWDRRLVLAQGRSTCSSKHALLKQIADLNGIPEIALILCIYRMNAFNTPGIGSVLAEHGLDYVPEAHCYLKIKGQPMDFTFSNSDFSRIEAPRISKWNNVLFSLIGASG